MEIPAHIANESIAFPRGQRRPSRELKHRIRAWVTAPSLDSRIAAGEDPSSEALLSCRSGQLLSHRSRRRLVHGLQRALAPPPDRAVISSAVPCNRQAVEVARPALEQLAQALRSRVGVRPRGVVLVHQLLTDPSSALYRPAELGELDEAARQALLALRL